MLNSRMVTGTSWPSTTAETASASRTRFPWVSLCVASMLARRSSARTRMSSSSSSMGLTM